MVSLLALSWMEPADGSIASSGDAKERRLLYAAVPGIRNYLEYGGHGLLIFDIDQGHKFVKRIVTAGLNKDGAPLNVKGICASAATRRIYISTTETMTCLDLQTEKILWERPYEGGCDRMAISPDGKVIYLPSLEKDHWHVVDALTGNVIKKIVTNSGSHNTVYGPDGKHVYLAGLRSPLLSVAGAKGHAISMTVGPFSASIRPFTVNGRQTLCFVNVNDLLGFEVGDLQTGLILDRVAADGYDKETAATYECPSHGIAFTPDERELWVADGVRNRLAVFDARGYPPAALASVELSAQPRSMAFSIDGRFAYSSTGEVIDAAARKIVGGLEDTASARVTSEHLVEIDFLDGRPIRSGS